MLNRSDRSGPWETAAFAVFKNLRTFQYIPRSEGSERFEVLASNVFFTTEGVASVVTVLSTLDIDTGPYVGSLIYQDPSEKNTFLHDAVVVRDSVARRNSDVNDLMVAGIRDEVVIDEARTLSANALSRRHSGLLQRLLRPGEDFSAYLRRTCLPTDEELATLRQSLTETPMPRLEDHFAEAYKIEDPEERRAAVEKEVHRALLKKADETGDYSQIERLAKASDRKIKT